MDDGTNIQARPTPTIFQIVISGVLIARARTLNLISLVASELRSIAVVFPRQTTAENTFSLVASTLRSFFAPVGTFSTGRVDNSFSLLESALRVVIVPVAVASSSKSSNTFSLTASTLRIVAKPVPNTVGTISNSFALVASSLT